MTRVAIVAGSPVLRAGLEALLVAAPTLVVVGTVAEPRAGERVALDELVAALDPDVVVWVPDDHDAEWLSTLRSDDGMPPGDDDARIAVERGSRRGRSAVVVLMQLAGGRSALAALRAGATGVLAREAGADEIIASIEAAAAGLVTMPADIAAELLADMREEAAPSATTTPLRGAALTAREHEVLALLAQGLANKAIAPRLGISEHTVKAHVASIFEKLHVGTRAEAVVTAARAGLLLL